MIVCGISRHFDTVMHYGAIVLCMAGLYSHALWCYSAMYGWSVCYSAMHGWSVG